MHDVDDVSRHRQGMLAAMAAIVLAGCGARTAGSGPMMAPSVLAGPTTTAAAKPTPATTTPETGRPATEATLVGTLEAVGGPAPGTPRPLAGTVTVTVRGSRHSVTVPVGAGGRYRIVVRPGRYSLTGRSPSYQDGRATCSAPTTVTVGAGKTVATNAMCEER